jgi:hypothetical protein
VLNSDNVRPPSSKSGQPKFWRPEWSDSNHLVEILPERSDSDHLHWNLATSRRNLANPDFDKTVQISAFITGIWQQ